MAKGLKYNLLSISQFCDKDFKNIFDDFSCDILDKKINTHVSHTHQAHILHAFLYGKVYTCTYCDRKGNLAKFCYDRINASNDPVWVRKTNTLGPKKV